MFGPIKLVECKLIWKFFVSYNKHIACGFIETILIR